VLSIQNGITELVIPSMVLYGTQAPSAQPIELFEVSCLTKRLRDYADVRSATQ